MGPWVHPGYSVAWFCVEERIVNTELSVGVSAVSVHFPQFAYAKGPKTIRLGIVFPAYSSAEIPKQKQVLRIQYLNSSIRVFVKLIFVLPGRA